MNPSKRDRYPLPKHLRHVWVRPEKFKAPVEGLVVDWRREGDDWSALVVFVWTANDQNVVCQTWFDQEALLPVKSQPDNPSAQRFIFGHTPAGGLW